MLQHLEHLSIYFMWRPVPHVLRCDEDHTVGIFCGDLSGNSPTYFSQSYINCSKTLDVPLFESSTLKNQSEEPFHIFVSYL